MTNCLVAKCALISVRYTFLTHSHTWEYDASRGVKKWEKRSAFQNLHAHVDKWLYARTCDDFTSTLVTTVFCHSGRFHFHQLHRLFGSCLLSSCSSYVDDCFSSSCFWKYGFVENCFSSLFVFHFCLLNNKALIFEFEWRKFTSFWQQELHQAVTLNLLPLTDPEPTPFDYLVHFYQ